MGQQHARHTAPACSQKYLDCLMSHLNQLYTTEWEISRKSGVTLEANWVQIRKIILKGRLKYWDGTELGSEVKPRLSLYIQQQHPRGKDFPGLWLQVRSEITCSNTHWHDASGDWRRGLFCTATTPVKHPQQRCFLVPALLSFRCKMKTFYYWKLFWFSHLRLILHMVTAAVLLGISKCLKLIF